MTEPTSNEPTDVEGADAQPQPWPNQEPPVEGVIPDAEISQDPDLLANDPDDNPDQVMES